MRLVAQSAQVAEWCVTANPTSEFFYHILAAVLDLVTDLWVSHPGIQRATIK